MSSITTASLLSPPHLTPSSPAKPQNLTNGASVRHASRSTVLTAPTPTLAPTYIQANLLVLPAQHAASFRLLCHRNPVPCPLLAESIAPGNFSELKSHIPGLTGAQIAADLDLRSDFPRYIVYESGKVVKDGVTDVRKYWRDDHVAFLVGCSFSFDAALVGARPSLMPPHVKFGRNVSMYRTNLPLMPSGKFVGSCMVVSMRMYRAREVEKVREVTRPYVVTHGEPVAWGWDAPEKLGVGDLAYPDWGDKPLNGNGWEGGSNRTGYDEGEDEYVPVFWGCGVTPQEAVMQAKIDGVVIGHKPGHMLVLDLRDWDILGKEI